MYARPILRVVGQPEATSPKMGYSRRTGGRGGGGIEKKSLEFYAYAGLSCAGVHGSRMRSSPMVARNQGRRAARIPAITNPAC